MPTVCIFAGSSNRLPEAYYTVARELGREIVALGADLLCGDAGNGLMKACADEVHAGGGAVHVASPGKWLVQQRQPDYARVTQVTSEAERFEHFWKTATGFVALPGSGPGSMVEVWEYISRRQYGHDTRRLILLDHADFWQPTRQVMLQNERLGTQRSGLCGYVTQPAQAARLALLR